MERESCTPAAAGSSCLSKIYPGSRPDAYATTPELAAAKNGTKSARGANFVCVLSGTAIDDDYVKTEGNAGRISVRLMAVVADGGRNRVYLSPNSEHELAAGIAPPDVPELEQAMPTNPRWFAPPDYGMPLYRDLFTSRQLIALTAFSDLVDEARSRTLADAKAASALCSRPAPDKPLTEGGIGPVAYPDS